MSKKLAILIASTLLAGSTFSSIALASAVDNTATASTKTKSEAYKSALITYRAALQAWRDTRDANTAAYRAAVTAHKNAAPTRRAAIEKINKEFNAALTTSKSVFDAAIAKSQTAAERKAAQDARDVSTLASKAIYQAALAAVPALSPKPTLPVIAPQPVAPIKP